MFDKLVIFHIIKKKSSFVPIAAIKNKYAKTVVTSNYYNVLA